MKAHISGYLYIPKDKTQGSIGKHPLLLPYVSPVKKAERCGSNRDAPELQCHSHYPSALQDGYTPNDEAKTVTTTFWVMVVVLGIDQYLLPIFPVLLANAFQVLQQRGHLFHKQISICIDLH